MALASGFSCVAAKAVFLCVVAVGALAGLGNADAVSKVNVVIVNNCSQMIWPSSGVAAGGLKHGESANLSLVNPSGNSEEPVMVSSVWAKTGCRNTTHGLDCDTGDCDTDPSRCSFNFPDSTPATAVEFGMTYKYLYAQFATLAGYNIGVSVATADGKTVLDCRVDVTRCPSANRVMDRQGSAAVGCSRTPDSHGFDGYAKQCCPLAFNGYTKPQLVDGATYIVTFCP